MHKLIDELNWGIIHAASIVDYVVMTGRMKVLMDLRDFVYTNYTVDKRKINASLESQE